MATNHSTRKRGQARAARLAALAAVGLVMACGSGDSKSVTAPPDPDPGTTTPERIVDQGVDITLKPGTRRISASLAQSALVSMDTATHQFTLDASQLAAAGATPKTGDVLMIDGIALRKVTGVSTSNGQLVVSTGDAVLTDAIQDGTIAWDAPLSFTSASVARARLVRPDGEMLVPQSSENGAVQFHYTAGDYTYTLDLLPINGPAQIVFQVKKETSHKVTAVFTFKGTISQGSSSGQIMIAQGSTQQFDYENKGIQGTIDLDFSIAGEDAQDFSFKFPQPVITFPIEVGPIPVLVTLKLEVATRIKVPLAFKASAVLSTKFVYSGDSGFSFAGGSFTNTSTMPAPVLGPSNADPAALIGGPVDAQIRLGIPRVEFGIFGNTIVPFFRIELFAGTQLYWGPVCKTATVQYLITAGADLKFLGKSLASLPGDTLVGPYTLTPPNNTCGPQPHLAATPVSFANPGAWGVDARAR